MKGARQRGPVRTERIFRKTLLASALYAVLSTPHAYAQSTGFMRDDNAFGRTVPHTPGRFDGRMIRAQQRASRNANVSGGDTKAPAMQPIQQVDQTPPARPPRHTVMTADERRLLRQHIEEAVRDLYKR
ncbi:hypothetical protein [Caballeronia ptereochthonis]|uniref:Peptide-binding protein n=1 Tax=Caballeronia ptereochthonis TaxID=1777144 RepID=A0A158ACR0_9BURK|nr:hypothetical protein [Caballeronia ptereochthonis]SAK55563.1 hypothetical protein AWB83_01659 [Caballeronia ptereochthonis]